MMRWQIITAEPPLIRGKAQYAFDPHAREAFESQVLIPALRICFAGHGDGPQRMTSFEWLGVPASAAIAAGGILAFAS
jgi:hypothetical protein